MGKDGAVVSSDVLVKICSALDCTMDDIVEIVYYYLFMGLSLTAIEQKLFKTEDYHGWLSKTFLNYYGINTEK